MSEIQYLPINSLKPNPRNARTHSRKQIKHLADAIKMSGYFSPVVIDEDRNVIAGHGRLSAAKLLTMTVVPTIQLRELSPAKKRALALADNKISSEAGWDNEILSVEFPELIELLTQESLPIDITGFAAPEVDQILADFDDQSKDPIEDIPEPLDCPPVSKTGDLWQLGKHRLLCGDARDPSALEQLLGDERAAMAFLDPPYNVRVCDIVGRGEIKHAEFAMGSGEMSRMEFCSFLKESLSTVAAISKPGAVHFVAMDWRHVGDLMEVGGTVYHETLNLIAWVKTNAGQGGFYRSQHELIGVFRVGAEGHLNNIELGKHGRNRSNVWRYAGANTFRAGRMDDLKAHPTVKPTALVADAMRDCTRRNDIVIDSFCGSGTTILAAERVGRRAFCVEIEPRFVDLAIRRWQQQTKQDAVHMASGLCFEEMSDTNFLGDGVNAVSKKECVQ